MGERFWGEIGLEEGYGNEIELKTSFSLTAEDIAKIVNQLDEDQRREVIYAIVGNAERAIDLLKDMGTDDRLQVFGGFCTHCGCDDPSCPCWNDE